MKQCRTTHDFSAILKDAELRVTNGRLAVLVALHAHGALSADEVCIASKEQFDRVTAYRILKQFLGAGIVVPRLRSDGVTRYQLADHHRHAVVCTECGVSEELTGCVFKEAEHEALAHVSRFSIVRAHAVEFFGICNRCAQV